MRQSFTIIASGTFELLLWLLCKSNSRFHFLRISSFLPKHFRFRPRTVVPKLFLYVDFIFPYSLAHELEDSLYKKIHGSSMIYSNRFLCTAASRKDWLMTVKSDVTVRNCGRAMPSIVLFVKNDGRCSSWSFFCQALHLFSHTGRGFRKHDSINLTLSATVKSDYHDLQQREDAKDASVRIYWHG